MSIFQCREKDDTLNVMVCGRLPRDAEIKTGDRGDRVKFEVNYGKNKYLKCEAWLDNRVGALAACFEKDDFIMACGTLRSWDHDGKTYHVLSADYVAPIYQPPQNANDPDAQDLSGAGEYAELKDDDEGLPF